MSITKQKTETMQHVGKNEARRGSGEKLADLTVFFLCYLLSVTNDSWFLGLREGGYMPDHISSWEISICFIFRGIPETRKTPKFNRGATSKEHPRDCETVKLLPTGLQRKMSALETVTCGFPENIMAHGDAVLALVFVKSGNKIT